MTSYTCNPQDGWKSVCERMAEASDGDEIVLLEGECFLTETFVTNKVIMFRGDGKVKIFCS